MSHLTLKDYTRMVRHSLVQVCFAEQALEEARFKGGFLGTTNHMFMARKLLLAKLQLEARKLAMKKSIFRQPKNTVTSPTANGQITVYQIKIHEHQITSLSDKTMLHFCYVLVIENDVKIVASQPTKPDSLGIVKFPGCMVFNQQSCDFKLQMSLYKLSLVEPACQSWAGKIKKLWCGFEVPKFKLMGSRTINISNINQNVFKFSDATLYIQLQINVGLRQV